MTQTYLIITTFKVKVRPPFLRMEMTESLGDFLRLKQSLITGCYGPKFSASQKLVNSPIPPIFDND